MASRHALNTQFRVLAKGGRGTAQERQEDPAAPAHPSVTRPSWPPDSGPSGAADQRPRVPVRLVSIDEAAKIMSISRAFFYRTILTPGRIARTVLGRRVLIPLDALDEYIESATIPAVDSGDGGGW
jgi:excisionase family DNA binding protein